MVAELITTILTLIRDINNHIDDYRCDDTLIDSIFHKIISIYPHIENLKTEDDQITSQNCQRLHVIICKIKKEIKDYKKKTVFGRFCSINELKSRCVDFDKDIDNIFKNLKFNLIIKNNKNSDNLINYKQEQIDYLKQTLNAKFLSNDIKKELIEDMSNINDKLNFIIDYIKEHGNENDTIAVTELTNSIMDIFHTNFQKLMNTLNSINFNICCLQSHINTTSIFQRCLNFIVTVFLFLFFIIITHLMIHESTENAKIYT